jgi:hypothetical protein
MAINIIRLRLEGIGRGDPSDVQISFLSVLENVQRNFYQILTYLKYLNKSLHPLIISTTMPSLHHDHFISIVVSVFLSAPTETNSQEQFSLK